MSSGGPFQVLPPNERVGLALWFGERCLLSLTDHPLLLHRAREALDAAWGLYEGRPVDPDVFDAYLDVDPPESSLLALESDLEEGASRSALYGLLLAIGFAAHRGYVALGRESSMSQIVEGATEAVLADLVRFAHEVDPTISVLEDDAAALLHRTAHPDSRPALQEAELL